MANEPMTAKELAAAKENFPAEGKSRVTQPPKTACIIIEESDEIPPTGLFLGLNGRGYMIQPGVAVTVPIGLVEILDNAKVDAPIIDPLTRRVTGTSKRSRFNYRVVDKKAA